jgi:hypothetical protein
LDTYLRRQPFSIVSPYVIFIGRHILSLTRFEKIFNVFF